MIQVNTRICGIPAILNVTHYHRVKGSYSYNAPSDWDYYGYTECEFEVCDRNGRRAEWLERKMKDADKQQAEQDIIEFMEDR